MRRNMMVVVAGMAIGVGGCGAFSAHPDVIEEAAGQKFTAQHLADMLNAIHAPNLQFDTKTGSFITTIWTDVTLFAQAAAENKLTADSALTAEAMWPMIAETVASRWVDTVVARRSKVDPAKVDSMYKLDTVRSVQHLLVKVDSTQPKEDKDALHKKAEGILAQIKGGEPFGKAAFDNTDDLASKADSGYYILKPKNMWDPPFTKAMMALKPGEVSGIVTGHYGFHIIRRPTEMEEKKFWHDSLARAASSPIITAYLAELGTTYGLKVDGAAVPHMRAAIDDIDGHASDNTALTTYKGGSFTVADFLRWIAAATADPQAAPGKLDALRKAPDSEYVSLARSFTQSDLLLREAAKNNIRLSPAEWKDVQTGFAAAVDSVKATIGLTPQVLDPKASTHDRKRAAGEKVDQYFNDLVSGKGAQLRPMPGMLAATLRKREKTHFNGVALARGLDLARAKHSADSAKAGAPGITPAPGAMKPAPGPAPVGGSAVTPAKP